MILFILFSIIILSGNNLFAESLNGLDRGQYFSNYPDITIEAGKSVIPGDSAELKRNLVLASLLSSSFLLDQGLRDFVQDSLLLSFQSLLVTQFYTALFKSTIGRTRPRNSINNPFELGEGGRSFFSGHSSGSWAVMTVFAERYPDYSLPYYSLATSIAASRIYEDAHWFSDVLVGSLVGYGIGKLTINLNESFDDKVLIFPIIKEDLAGISFEFNF